MLLGLIGFLLTASQSLGAGLITYHCDELVVVGRLRAVSYADRTAKDDILGHGQYSMEVAVKRVLYGRENRRVLPVLIHAHGQMRDDADFWLVLTRGANGSYSVRAANLTHIPYKLAPKCEWPQNGPLSELVIVQPLA